MISYVEGVVACAARTRNSLHTQSVIEPIHSGDINGLGGKQLLPPENTRSVLSLMMSIGRMSPLIVEERKNHWRESGAERIEPQWIIDANVELLTGKSNRTTSRTGTAQHTGATVDCLRGEQCHFKIDNLLLNLRRQRGTLRMPHGGIVGLVGQVSLEITRVGSKGNGRGPGLRR